MADIPAICRTCGTFFTVRNLFGGPGSGIISFRGCSVGPCPKCGGNGDIPDGRFEMVNDAVRLIAGVGRSPEQLIQLADILRHARQQQAAPQVVAQRIDIEAPELGAFAAWMRQYLVPKTAADVYALIGIILTAIGVMISLAPQKESKKGFSDQDVAAIVEKAVAAAITQTRVPAQASPAAAGSMAKAKKKTGRNDPCPCNSGKKYKICCINQANRSSR
jgi:hypothetical protein